MITTSACTLGSNTKVLPVFCATLAISRSSGTLESDGGGEALGGLSPEATDAETGSQEAGTVTRTLIIGFPVSETSLRGSQSLAPDRRCTRQFPKDSAIFYA